VRSEDVSLKELKTLPGVGKKLARELYDLGYRHVSDLENEDPEKMYQQLCYLRGKHIDRCVLYVFRCAVYYASNGEYTPELLKWWNWKGLKQGRQS